MQSEGDILAFVQAFRELIRTMNVLKCFSEFSFDDLAMNAQTFEDYKSTYLDIFDRTRDEPESAESIVQDVDFELELIHRNELSFAYILNLVSGLHNAENSDDQEQREQAVGRREAILKLLNSETQLCHSLSRTGQVWNLLIWPRRPRFRNGENRRVAPKDR